MQVGWSGCRYFALNAALTMSKITNFHDLARSSSEEIQPCKNINIKQYIVDAFNLPARLMKNIMRNDLIKEYDETHKDNQDELNKIIVKKGSRTLTLKKYTASRSFNVPSEDDPKVFKLRNLGLFFTRAHYKKIIEEHDKNQEQVASRFPHTK
ncbi:unnamed protein product [marine sediment metagenome]|uniref:Uncharacterized protein n=1 Tax=marine sediment metagenome TaxID=412755 RepID=X1Q0C9_9ZZZZ